MIVCPFPSVHFTSEDESSPTGLRLAYESEFYRGPDGVLDFTWDCRVQMVTPVGPALVNFGVDIDPSFLSGWGDQEETAADGALIALIHAETGESIPILAEMDQAQRMWTEYDAHHPLIIRPLAPMDFGARYFVVLSNELTDVDGAALPGSDVFNALRDGVITTDDTIEAMRPRYDSFFETIETRGWQREELLLAWEFQVASEHQVLGPMRTMRDHVINEVDPTTIEYVIDSVEVDPSESAAYVIQGTFAPPNFLLEDNTLGLDEEGLPIVQEDRPFYNFTMTVPAVAKERGDLSLILVGHGIFGTGEGMIASGGGGDIFHPLANELNAVLVATDWVGMSAGDRDLIIEEVLPDVERVRVVTDRLAQSHVNNLTLVEMALTSLINDDVIELPHDQNRINPEQVYYYGISLGGIQGTGTTAISPRISRSVVAVPGAGWAHLIQRSTQFEPLEVIFDNFFPDPLSQSLLLGMAQTFFDWSDPGN